MIELCHCKNNAFSGDADMVKLLLDYGASVNEGENDHFPDYPAIFQACGPDDGKIRRAKLVETVRLLLEAGAEVNGWYCTWCKHI